MNRFKQAHGNKTKAYCMYCKKEITDWEILAGKINMNSPSNTWWHKQCLSDLLKAQDMGVIE